MSKEWKKIEDEKVIHVWKCEEEDCEEGNPVCEWHPEDYQDSGTPVCACDNDMVYQYTQIYV